ncbi:hypothetical protein EVAR_24495_1 [Eumeta japonica]|uniref:Uncharacterized protein n=1 Tax=Eumeta variegata TaxID=151549 RepID=A0A4C1URH9_EUMVA|nr:hypothetical protein EVAR_24495_1 [Eumeta japonica]
MSNIYGDYDAAAAAGSESAGSAISPAFPAAPPAARLICGRGAVSASVCTTRVRSASRLARTSVHPALINHAQHVIITKRRAALRGAAGGSSQINCLTCLAHLRFFNMYRLPFLNQWSIYDTATHCASKPKIEWQNNSSTEKSKNRILSINKPPAARCLRGRF